MDSFTQGYIEAALWASTDDQGNPLDSKYSLLDLAPETIARMTADCEKFQTALSEKLPEASHKFGELDLYVGDDGRIYGQ